jgi:hypothetical protein
MIDRFITTKMSANIVAALLKLGWTPERIASAIKAPVTFVRGVQAKQQVLTFADIRELGRRSRQSPHLMLLNAIPPAEINPELKALFSSTREALAASAQPGNVASATTSKKRRSRPKAA